MKKTLVGCALVVGLTALALPVAGQDTTSLLSVFLSTWVRCGGAGHLKPCADATYDIGATGANRPRSIYISGSMNIQGGSFAIGNGGQYQLGASAVPVLIATAPTISSGFGTSPSIVSSNGSASFRVNVGTGGAATTGVVGMPTATTGWNCQVTDFTNNTVTRQTGGNTTTVSVTAAAAWAASDVLIFNCAGY